MTPRILEDDEPAVSELLVLVAEARRVRRQARGRVDPQAWAGIQVLTARLAAFLAGLLVGFSPHHVMELVRIFLRAFLTRLAADGKLPERAMVELAGLPLDIALELRAADREGGEA